MLAIHQFLWDDEGKNRLETLITTTTERVPPLYAKTHERPKSCKVKKYNLTGIPGYGAYKQERIPENQPVETFYYRDEYNEVDELEQASAHGSMAFNILLLGHPGIGKTTYLTYCLVNRLARKQPTCLLMSPENRYLFVDEGVFHIPGDERAVDDLVLRHRTLDSLVLYDLNEEHARVEPSLFRKWRAIVTSSPRPSRYQDWVKHRMPKKFVMKTWSWEEVYTARSMSLVERDTDAWRDAFLKWGGSARYLFSSSEGDLEEALKDAAQQADVKTLLIGTDSSMANKHRHRLVLANPLHKNGEMSRDIMASELISPYITRVLVEQCQKEMTRSLIENVERSLLHGVVGSQEGFLFEEFGHTIVQRYLKHGFEAQELLPKDGSASASPQLIKFKFAGFDDQTPQYFNKGVRPQELDTDRYYRPDTKTFAGIDAFALGSKTIVLFQFTIAKDHKINAKWLYDWYKSSAKMKKTWKWKLIFVIPKKRPQLTTFQSMTHKTMEKKISQYVLEIDVNTYLA
ncbi:hypothetical protein K435DRAFT_469056 [Dendrothele bispora CBS 962.96]|uniref:Uncharacterized protein n=1 Tax=Dendrothele bispora (strain CBS 962.96) TaxID=1314807 RepID=A0A4S8L0C6_DENBC|nr:hypothetical protein K435DRAFT_469056 [Dendrothele bispora CBS 962.96]